MAQNHSSVEADEKLVRQLVLNFQSAWNQHDVHAFAECFSEDADFTNVIGLSAHGKSAVEKFHAPIFETMFKHSHQTATEVRIRFITPDVASVDVQWEMTGATAPNGTPISLRMGLLNWLVTRHGNKWLITVMHNQELAPRKE